MTQTANVTPIHPEAEGDDYAAVNAFDNLISDWLAIEAKVRDSRRDTSDAALGRICEQRWKLLWKVASTPAELKRHIIDKILVLEQYVDDLDRSTLGMLASIRADIDHL